MKIVINSCIGGFGLSHFGSLKYMEEKFGECCAYSRRGRGSHVKIKEPKDDDWYIVYLGVDCGEVLQDYNHNKAYEENKILHEIDLGRDDEILVGLIEKYGELMNGDSAELKVVEIPDDVDWIIHENEMGVEWISEKCRTWG